MVLPLGEVILSSEIAITEASELPSKTYRLDLKRGRCIGMIDGTEAIGQAAFKILNTERFEHLIYSDDYGFESLIGKDEVLTKAEVPRRVKEALLQDERIQSVEGIDFISNKENAFIPLTVKSIYGDIELLQEVPE